MKRRTLLSFAALVIGALVATGCGEPTLTQPVLDQAFGHVPGSTPTVIVPWADEPVLYRFNSGNVSGFEAVEFDDSGWAEAPGAFGTPGCPLAPTIRTPWTLNTTLLLRKRFSLPAGTTHLTVGVAIDNDIQVFLNGTDISGGVRASGGCAVRDRFVFAAPDAILQDGENVLAIRAIDRGIVSYVDAQVTASIPEDVCPVVPAPAPSLKAPPSPLQIEVEVYDRELNLRHNRTSDIHFGDRIFVKATGNPLPGDCPVTYEWKFSHDILSHDLRVPGHTVIPNSSQAELFPLALDESQAQLLVDKLGKYEIEVVVRRGNASASAAITLDVNTMDLYLGFFSGDPRFSRRTGERTTAGLRTIERRLEKAQTGRYGYLENGRSGHEVEGSSERKNGFLWWEHFIESNSGFEIEYHLLEDDTETMGKFDSYSPDERKTRGQERFLVGPANAINLLGPPAQTFHIAVFRSNQLWFIEGDGTLVKKDHVISFGTDLVMTRTDPQGFSGQEKPLVAEHEIGHLFGLRHRHGGIMSADPKVFKKGAFKREWLEDIITHLNEMPVR